MGARLDEDSLRAQEPAKFGDVNLQNLSVYHDCAAIYRTLTDRSSKYELVSADPKIAAQVFYHFRDSELGGLIVRNYLGNADDSLREIALAVKGVLDLQKKQSSNLANILGIRSVSATPESLALRKVYNGDFYDGLFRGSANPMFIGLSDEEIHDRQDAVYRHEERLLEDGSA